MVSVGSYVLVEDTWQRHPLVAVNHYLGKYGDEFIQDTSREHLIWSQHKVWPCRSVSTPA